jgi:oligopeptidase B
MKHFKQTVYICVLFTSLFSCKTQETILTKTDMTDMDMNKEIKRSTPIAAKEAKSMVIHGHERIDNYYWMRLTDEQKSAQTPDEHTQKVLSYLNAENDYREKETAHLDKFEDKLFDEIVGRIKQTDLSVPYKYNGYYYITKYEEGKEYSILTRKKESLDNEEEVYLDMNKLAEGHAYYNVNNTSISPDNKLLAYSEDTVSRRIYTIKFKDLESGELMDDKIEGVSGSAVWANDNKTIFYVKKDPVTLRSEKVYRHTLGTNQDQDVLVYHEQDETFNVGIYKTTSRDFIMIFSSHTLTSEYQYLSADNPNGDFQLFEARDLTAKHEYYVTHYDDHWYVRSNENAPNFKLLKTPILKTAKNNWTEVIPHREDVFLSRITPFRNYMALSERINGITELRVKTWDGSTDYYIELDEPSHLVYPSTNLDFDTETLRIGYQSMKTPNSIYDFNMNTKERVLLKQSEVVGDFTSSDYKTDRIMATARDGVKVPVSIIYHKDTPIDGTAPCLLYAYGSYGSNMEPYFSSTRLSLLDRGFVYAIAHIRGGQEMGKQWYENGKLLKKKNTFYDFIDCGKQMIQDGYANEEKLFAMGGSAGGLLMGAIMNMEPNLWKGVVAAVPFVDVVTTMLDETIPLTTFEWDEWGNPENEEYYNYMLSYSPYDNVEAKDYPTTLVTTGLFDSQVQYWEPAKWVAKLRELKTDDNPLYMYCNMDTGHGGASGRFARHRETAMEYAFLLDLADLVDKDEMP